MSDKEKLIEKELDAIINRLDIQMQRNKQIQLIKAQAEIETINRCAVAYVDGLYDMAKEVKNLLQKLDKEQETPKECE